MNSMKCPTCGLTNWASEETCKRCKNPLHMAHQAPQQQTEVYQSLYSQTSNQSGYAGQQQYQHYSAPSQNLKTGLAITSMVMAIISWPTTILLIGLLIAPIAFVLGIVAVVKANKRPHEFGGKGFAIAGIAISSCVFLLMVPIIAAIAIPNLLAARRAANEGSAVRALTEIYAAEQTYVATRGAGRCGDVNALFLNDLLRVELADGEHNGYKFSVVNHKDPRELCEVHAVPMSSSWGERSFMIDEYGQSHAAAKKGDFADRNDPPLNSDRQVR